MKMSPVASRLFVEQRRSRRKFFNLYGVMLYKLPVGFVWLQSAGMRILPDNGPTPLRIKLRRRDRG